MTSWLAAFVAITGLAVLLQAVVLAAMYFQMRQATRRIETIATDLQEKVNPILSRIQILTEDVQPRISTMVSDAAEITHLARSSAQRMDRAFTEMLDRLRLQLVHADQILTGALEAVDQAGTQFRKTVLGPMQSASALIRGIQTGLEFFRSSRRSRPESSAAPHEPQDEGLFI
jgi:predicted PurR-regulated permease PerM